MQFWEPAVSADCSAPASRRSGAQSPWSSGRNRSRNIRNNFSWKVAFGNFTVPVSRAAEVPPSDVLWITVKATQLDAALQSITNPDSVGKIVPLLNGIDHIALSAEEVRGRTRSFQPPSPSRLNELRRANSSIVRLLPAERLLRRQTKLGATIEALQKFGFECRFIDDEITLMWSKLVFLAAFALSTTAADKNDRRNSYRTRSGGNSASSSSAKPAPSRWRKARRSTPNK